MISEANTVERYKDWKLSMMGVVYGKWREVGQWKERGKM
jgi:hypothetical protein